MTDKTPKHKKAPIKVKKGSEESCREGECMNNMPKQLLGSLEIVEKEQRSL